MTDPNETCTCGAFIGPDDPAAKVFNPNREGGESIVCGDCAKRGGVDPTAFVRPLRDVVG